jgi:hypothetical protein
MSERSLIDCFCPDCTLLRVKQAEERRRKDEATKAFEEALKSVQREQKASQWPCGRRKTW